LPQVKAMRLDDPLAEVPHLYPKFYPGGE